MTKHVIIGNGIAGLTAAETIRQLDPEASITVIAAENHPPYSRPMISLLLEGSISTEQLTIRPHDYYQTWKLETLIGHRVIQVDPEAKEVYTDQGQTTGYDRLLIATGADPRPVKAEGFHIPGIHFMRTIDQVQAMINELPQVKTALVLGGGLVGFKAAYGLLKRGRQVTMLIGSGYPLSMQADETAGKMIADELISHGLTIKVRTEVTALEGQPRVQAAILADGSRVTCDLVVVGKGVDPARGLIFPTQIAVNQGILVDNHLRTSDPYVYAAGDVAEAMDMLRGRPGINAIWPVAAQQGYIAGQNMAGRPVAYDGSLGRNVIRVFNLDVLTAGLVNPGTDETYRVVSRQDPRRGTYRKLVFKDDRLVGLVLVGDIDQGGILTALIHSRRPIGVAPEILLEPNFNFGRLMP